MLKQILAAENLNQPNLNAETENLSDITDDNGQLFVKVIQCSNFLIPHEKECTGLYAIISLEKQELRTSTLEIINTGSDQKKTVEWNQECALDVTQPEATLAITVFAKYPRTSLSIGKITLPVSQLRREVTEAKYILRLRRVDDSTLELAPELHLSVRFLHMSNKVGPDDFEILAVVGKGSFGKVFQVRKKDTGNIFAMKVIRKDNVVKRNAVEHTMAENKILKHINHPFLVNLKYAFQTKLHLYMVIDYLNGGELFYHLTRDDYFSEERTRFYAAEVVLALGYLHDNNIVYRDLKPENLLLDMQGHICLVDFGLCKTGLGFDTKTHTFCGSPEYIAPEVLRGEGYNKEVDWWALGTLIYEMLTGLPPFWSEDEDVMHNKIQYAPLQFPPNFSEAVKDLLRGLLNRNPKKRLGTGLDGTEDIKKHPWFNTLNWRKLYNREAEPPFKPHITNMLDLNYFDEEFTREAPQLSYTGTPGFKFDQDIFSGFSYNGESEMRNFGDHPMPPSSLSRNGALERRRRFSSANAPPPVGSVNSRLKVAISNSYKTNNIEMMESDYDESLEDKMVRMNSLQNDNMNITPVSSLHNAYNVSKSPQSQFVQGRVASNNFQRPGKPQSPQRKMLIGVNKEVLSPRDDMDDMSEDDFDDENHTPSSQSTLMFALE